MTQICADKNTYLCHSIFDTYSCQIIYRSYDRNRYIENLKSFLAERTPHFGYDDANSILEMLYYYYTVANPVDNAVIRCQFKELNDILCRLSYADNEAVFALAGSLCAAHERQAFLDGIHVGLRLAAELSGLPG